MLSVGINGANQKASVERMQSEVQPPANEKIWQVRFGYVKSFSQSKGWGFLNEESGDEAADADPSKDVFFHRADIARSGRSEIHPGTKVQYRVAKTKNGTKAMEIQVLEEESSPSDESIGHSPTLNGALTPTSHSTSTECSHSASTDSLKSLITQGSDSAETEALVHCIYWDCTFDPKDMLQCPVTSLGAVDCFMTGQMDGWLCTCGQINSSESCHCPICDVPLSVEAKDGNGKMVLPYPIAGSPPHVMPDNGLQHVDLFKCVKDEDKTSGAAELTDLHELLSGALTGDHKKASQELFRKCEPHLLRARDWLLRGAPANPEDCVLTPAWLHRFSEEVCKPQHRLLCLAHGSPALVPNPCADLQDRNTLLMYEAIGRVLALALAHRVPLSPALPVWMARALLGHPPTPEDLKEFDPQLSSRVQAVMNHPNPEALGLRFSEVIERYGSSRKFGATDGALVTRDNRHMYEAWLMNVYLRKSLEKQLEYTRRGFDHTLTDGEPFGRVPPAALSRAVTGDPTPSPWALQQCLRFCDALQQFVPHLETWFSEAVTGLSAPQWQELLRFATGFSKAPCGGPEAKRPHIIVSFNPSLPPNGPPLACAMTNQVFLPQYSGPRELRQMLMAALAAQTQGFQA